MAVHPVETYLKDLGEIHRTGGGVGEESSWAPWNTCSMGLDRGSDMGGGARLPRTRPSFGVAHSVNANYHVN
jgi:hypothetical protein